MQTLKILSASSISFGSGSTHTVFRLNNKRVVSLPYETVNESNGFILSTYSFVPVKDILSATIIYSDGAIPGGGQSYFKGTGRKFLNWLLKCNASVEDPLFFPLRRGLPRLPRSQKRIEEKQENKFQLVVESFCNKIMRGQGKVEKDTPFEKKHITLRDGSKGYIWIVNKDLLERVSRRHTTLDTNKFFNNLAKRANNTNLPLH